MFDPKSWQREDVAFITDLAEVEKDTNSFSLLYLMQPESYYAS